jgi:L-threonylcarbamoyladenylate synthase
VSYWTKNFDGQVTGLLQNGGVGFMPSDTVYGLSCRALNRPAVERIYEIKGRDWGKPFIILISSLEMLDLLSIDREEVKPAEKYWPGPLTIICSAPAAPAWLHRGTQTLAVRIPNQPELLKLIDQTGPLVSTSANQQGHTTAASAAEAKEIFGETLDFYVDQGRLSNKSSTIVKLEQGKLKVLRQGATKL